MGLFGKKSDHPLADPKSALQVLEDLPKNDNLKSLQEIADWLESVREEAGFRLDEKFTALRLLDETGRAFERKLTRELYSSDTLTRFQENRLWAALNKFYSHLSQGYGEVLIGCRDGEKGSAALKSLHPLIAARAIHAVRGWLKCAAVHYAPFDTAAWALLALCYSNAEMGNYLNEPVTLYTGGSSSVRCEFTATLLWWLSSNCTLKPRQLHLAERLSAYLCDSYTVDTQPIAGTLLFFDVVRPIPPVRFTGEATMHPRQRFIGLGEAPARLEALIQTLDKGIIPDDLNLGGIFEPEVVKEVVNHLLVMWSDPPPMRRAPRRRINVNLHVTGGFSGVVEQTDVGLNFSVSETENWEVEEISANGFRCVLPPPQSEDVKIGLLIGIRPENVSHWGVGIVRRLGRDAENRLHVGVEVLANCLEGVTLREGSAGLSEDQPALWLFRGNGDDEGEAWLLMRPDAFSINRSLNMLARDKPYLLMPLALMEKGEDYDFARFRKIEQETTADEEKEAY